MILKNGLIDSVSFLISFFIQFSSNLGILSNSNTSFITLKLTKHEGWGLERLALFFVDFYCHVNAVHLTNSITFTIPKKVFTSISPLLPVSASLHRLWTFCQHDRIWEHSLLSTASGFSKVPALDCPQTAEEGLSCSGPNGWTRRRFSSINHVNVMLLYTDLLKTKYPTHEKNLINYLFSLNSGQDYKSGM